MILAGVMFVTGVFAGSMAGTITAFYLMVWLDERRTK